MHPEVQSICIKYITDEWQKLRPLKGRDEPLLSPPWGVWIYLYDPISPETDFIDSRENALRKAWLLSSQGVQERDPWEYARFIVVNWYCPWATGNRLPQIAIWGYYHQIAVAAFAEFIDTDALYLETHWGKRWGRGYRMKVTEQRTLPIEETLWRS